MNAKQFVEMVSRMTLGEGEAMDALIQSAREIVGATSSKGEAGKQAKDVQRAQAAIAALDRFIANPNITRMRTASEPPISIEVREGAAMERDRLMAALPNPEALKMIYRRNEVRR